MGTRNKRKCAAVDNGCRNEEAFLLNFSRGLLFFCENPQKDNGDNGESPEDIDIYHKSRNSIHDDITH